MGAPSIVQALLADLDLHFRFWEYYTDIPHEMIDGIYEIIHKHLDLDPGNRDPLTGKE